MTDEPEREPRAIDKEGGGPGADMAEASNSGLSASKRHPVSDVRDWLRSEFRTPDPDTYDNFRRFPTNEDELAAKLATDAPDVSAAILAEAREYADRSVDSRVDSVERRAATLQSATAIAGSFTLAGGVLVATDVRSNGWQIAIGAVLLFVALNLGMCGWRATQASSRVINWSREPAKHILKRSEQTTAQANIDRATQTLLVADWNGRYARWKVDMLKRAGRHLVRATLGLPLLLAVVLAYVIAHPDASNTSNHPHRSTILIRISAHRPGGHDRVRPGPRAPRQQPLTPRTTTSH